MAAMTTPSLHMMKLCVGAPHPEALERWQAERFGGGPAEHITRMWPKRAEELLAGLLIFRLLYYITPLALALTVLGIRELLISLSKRNAGRR